MLALALLTFSTRAQAFTTPYCKIVDTNNVTVEEITTVSFAGTTIINTDTNTVLIDETSNTVFVIPNDTYTI